MDAGTYNVTVIADNMEMLGKWTGTGVWTLEPETASRPILLGAATDDPSSLTLTLTDLADLNESTPLYVAIGVPIGNAADAADLDAGASGHGALGQRHHR